MGEVTSDYLVVQLGAFVAIALGGTGLVAALAAQFAVRGYRPAVYWAAVVMVAIFGTMMADAIHVGLGIPYLVSSLGFGLSLVIIFLVWYRTEGTLSIQASRSVVGAICASRCAARS